MCGSDIKVHKQDCPLNPRKRKQNFHDKHNSVDDSVVYARTDYPKPVVIDKVADEEWMHAISCFVPPMPFRRKHTCQAEWQKENCCAQTLPSQMHTDGNCLTLPLDWQSANL